MSSKADGKKPQLMPGTFSPEDFIDFYYDGLQELEKIQARWSERDIPVRWSTNNLSEVDVTGINWHEYSPPAVLRRAPNITSPVLLDVLYSSLENVRARAAEQHRQELEEKEKRKLEDDVKRLEKGKGKESYLPIIIPENKPTSDNLSQPEDLPPLRLSTTSQSTSTSTHVDTHAKPKKRRMFVLHMLFQRSQEKGESSATGSATESLRKRYDFQNTSVNSIPKKVVTEEDVECVSCLDDFPPKQMIKVPCHSYCRDCFVRLISAAVQNEQQWPPKCCLNPIPVQPIFRVIPSNLKKTFQERAQEWDIPIAERVYCSHQGCGLWVKPSAIDTKKRQGVCSSRHYTCTICRGHGHKGKDCERDPDMELTNILAEEEGWRRCFNCNALVEHREACQHMTCRCGTEFCYICGERWKTCNCTMQQLYDIKSAAENRREQRQLREQADADELRKILLQIEEFEREEALKAEILRQEQERLQEERRQRELEERARQESLRRNEVELKYQELRISLDQLHELQLVLFDIDQEQLSNDLIAGIYKAKDELTKKQETERFDLNTLVITKLTDKEFTLNKEFQIRAAEENDIEEAYHEKLREYWQGKKNGGDEIEMAMLALRKRMDQGHHAWQKWKKEALRRFEANLKENLALKEELMYSAKSRLADACEQKEKDLEKRKAAENKWLEMVVVEREKLLSEWEVQEVEGDADSIFASSSDNGGEEDLTASS